MICRQPLNGAVQLADTPTRFHWSAKMEVASQAEALEEAQQDIRSRRERWHELSDPFARDVFDRYDR